MRIRTSARFENALDSLDARNRKRLEKLIRRIIDDPSRGKPLRYARKGERTMRMGARRLIYSCRDDTLYLLSLENRDRVYA